MLCCVLCVLCTNCCVRVHINSADTILDPKVIGENRAEDLCVAFEVLCSTQSSYTPSHYKGMFSDSKKIILIHDVHNS